MMEKKLNLISTQLIYFYVWTSVMGLYLGAEMFIAHHRLCFSNSGLDYINKSVDTQNKPVLLVWCCR